jgi:2Fe-2S ferredoxin
MPRITYIDFDGTQHLVEAETGISLMEAARDNGITSIEAECGGACACATCHVFVDKDWRAVIGSACGPELELLECTESYEEGSRLSCQITIGADMDGLVVRLPEVQG